jgi:hypothetical protein
LRLERVHDADVALFLCWFCADVSGSAFAADEFESGVGSCVFGWRESGDSGFMRAGR